MIHPINNHVLIEPMKHESFIESQKNTFEEIGIVIDLDRRILDRDWGIPSTDGRMFPTIVKGSKVYFDSWLASKYPAEKDGEFYWLVDYKDIKAVDNGDKIPELSVSERSSSPIPHYTPMVRGDHGEV